jgi:hypothetical protein
MAFPYGANLYGVGVGTYPENVEVPFISNRAPTVNDILFPVGKRWVDSVTTSTAYTLIKFTSTNGVLQATWVNI